MPLSINGKIVVKVILSEDKDQSRTLTLIL